jgi:hypothetical protein
VNEFPHRADRKQTVNTGCYLKLNDSSQFFLVDRTIIEVLGSRFIGSGFNVQGSKNSGFKVQSSGFRGSRFKKFRVQGLAFWVQRFKDSHFVFLKSKIRNPKSKADT